jgi:carbonic anhydrase
MRLSSVRLDLGARALWPEWRRLLSRQDLKSDVLAALRVAGAALPFSLAIALASGVSPALGVVSAVLGGVAGALFGGSPLAVTGPALGLAVLIGNVVEHHGVAGVLIVGLGCGLLQLAFGVAKLGRVLQLVPVPVVAGLSAGIAVVVMIGQLPRMLGLPAPDESHVFEVVSHIRNQLDQIDVTTLLLSVSTLVLCLALPRRWPRWPSALGAVLLSALVVAFLPEGVATVGDLPKTLPVPRLPMLSATAIRSLLSSTLMLFALASLEAARATGALEKRQSPDADRVDIDQELIGQGLANVLATLFGGIPVTSLTARSQVNVKAGAKTRRAALLQAILLVALVLVARPLIARIPLASLAAVLLVVAVRKLQVIDFRKLARTSRSDVTVYAVTFVVMVVGDLFAGVQVGLIAAFLIAAIRLGQLQVTLKRAGDTHARLSLQGPLTFLSTGSLDPLRQSLAEGTPPKELVIDLTSVSTLDVSGAEMLGTLVDQLHARGCRVALTGLAPSLEPILRGADPDGHVMAQLARSEGDLRRLLDAEDEVARPIDRLVRGVDRFRADMSGHYEKLFESLADGQAPHTLFITCSDSRVVPNLITSTDPGELFVVRNVGNIVPAFEAGALCAEGAAVEYAVSVLGVKEIIVCGHSGCGAMKALVAGKPIALPNLDHWLSNAGAVRLLGDNPTAESAAQFNALRQLVHIITYPMVRDKVAAGELRLHAWYYDIGSSSLYEWNDATGTLEPLSGETAQSVIATRPPDAGTG